MCSIYAKQVLCVCFSAEDANSLPLIDIATYRDINVLGNIELSLCTIYKKPMNLRPEKSSGVDNIYPVVLCDLASALSIPLCNTYQLSIEYNVISDD